MSSFIVMKPILPFLLFFLWWRISNATRILSLIALFDWKALCDSEIISSRIFFNQFAKTFEINLYRMLHRAIRQNSVTCSGLLTFGISVMYLWFKPAGITPEFIQEITALVNGEQHIVHIIGDHLWNKLKDKVYFTRVRCSEQRVIIINNNICYIIFTRTYISPIWFRRPSIWFRQNLCEAFLWKKAVFLSPDVIQWALERYCQSFSSLKALNSKYYLHSYNNKK